MHLLLVVFFKSNKHMPMSIRKTRVVPQSSATWKDIKTFATQQERNFQSDWNCFCKIFNIGTRRYQTYPKYFAYMPIHGQIFILLYIEYYQNFRISQNVLDFQTYVRLSYASLNRYLRDIKLTKYMSNFVKKKINVNFLSKILFKEVDLAIQPLYSMWPSFGYFSTVI